MFQPKVNGVETSRPACRRPRADLERLAVANLAAALSVAVLQAAEPFEHGVWLVAYLFLVGFLAQFLLARGQVALLAGSRRPDPPAPMRRVQLVLWNFGVLIVPFGVLAGSTDESQVDFAARTSVCNSSKRAPVDDELKRRPWS